MNELANFWNTIVQTNTFNFAILVLIFAIIFRKIKIGEILENLKDDIVNAIRNAEEEKNKAAIDLTDAKKSVEHLDDEIKKTLQDADNRAKLIAEQILSNTQKEIDLIKSNIDKVIISEEKTLSAGLTDKTAKASIALARNHIKSVLDNQPELHDKYINESINELDRIQL